MKTYCTWIDNVKAICMIGVYLLHSEVYYGFGDIQYGLVFTPFYVNAFFFVSGYLFFSKQLYNSKTNNWGEYWEALQNIIYRLMIPTLIFSAIMFLPKMMFHGTEINISTFLIHVFGGIHYWFTSALLVAQVVLLTMIRIMKRDDIWSYFYCSVLLFACGWYLNNIRTDSSVEAFFPWFWKTGIENTLIMACGGLYMQYEKRINSAGYSLFILSVLIYGILAYKMIDGTTIPMMGRDGRCNIMGGLIIAAGITLITTVCHKIKDNRILSFIGRNSIIFYFFSGAFPAFIGMVAQRFFPEQIYAITIFVAFLSIVLAWFAAMVINKYFPCLIDLRKLWHK